MRDRLVEILKHFDLRASVFQSGPLCRTVEFAANGQGYFHLLKDGCVRVDSPNHRPLLINEPTLFFYLNSTQHRLIPENGQAELVCASLEFGTGLNNPLTAALPEMTVLKLQEVPALSLSLQLLFQESSQIHCGRQAVLDRLVEVVMIMILRDMMNQKRLHIGLLAGLADPRLVEAINAIHENPAAPWTLDTLAQKANMSRARFAVRFHEVVGKTPGDYLSEWRIALAQSMLRKGKSIQLTADSVGYANASALSRAFRARTGMSPKEWLKINER